MRTNNEGVHVPGRYQRDTGRLNVRRCNLRRARYVYFGFRYNAYLCKLISRTYYVDLCVTNVGVWHCLWCGVRACRISGNTGRRSYRQMVAEQIDRSLLGSLVVVDLRSS